jgi:uncharacterized protein YecT (DUF1311 family)
MVNRGMAVPDFKRVGRFVASPIWFVLPLVCLATACQASDCANPTTQAAMSQCAANDYGRADAAMNQTYRTLFAVLDAPHRQGLTNAQRAWSSYRDAHCRSETMDSRGGSMHGLLYDACLADATRKRTRELQASLDCRNHVGKCND